MRMVAASTLGERAKNTATPDSESMDFKKILLIS
jgi:hypothetical protein